VTGCYDRGTKVRNFQLDHKFEARELIASRSGQIQETLPLHRMHSNILSGTITSICATHGFHWLYSSPAILGAQYAHLHQLSPQHAKELRVWIDRSLCSLLHRNCCKQRHRVP
jgi:hypothetical protein